MINGEHVIIATSSTRHLSSSYHESLTDKFKYKPPKRFSSRHIFWICVSITSLLGVFTIVVYICWPRIPRLLIKSEKAERIGEPADWGPHQQPWLRAEWKLNMTLNNQANFVPTRIKNIELVLMDRDTHLPFAWSRTGPLNLAPRKDTTISLLFRVDYEPQSVDDPTFKNLYNACGPQMPTESPPVNVTLQAGRSKRSPYVTEIRKLLTFFNFIFIITRLPIISLVLPGTRFLLYDHQSYAASIALSIKIWTLYN